MQHDAIPTGSLDEATSARIVEVSIPIPATVASAWAPEELREAERKVFEAGQRLRKDLLRAPESTSWKRATSDWWSWPSRSNIAVKRACEDGLCGVYAYPLSEDHGIENPGVSKYRKATSREALEAEAVSFGAVDWPEGVRVRMEPFIEEPEEDPFLGVPPTLRT